MSVGSVGETSIKNSEAKVYLNIINGLSSLHDGCAGLKILFPVPHFAEGRRNPR